MDVTKTHPEALRFSFLAGILFKGGISAAEIITGILAIFIPHTVVTNYMHQFASLLSTTPIGPLLTSHIDTAAVEIAAISSGFIALYLISRGLIKFALIVALLVNQLWAYPTALLVMGLFVAYQLYQIITTHSPFILAITIFDLVVMWLIWEEYRVQRRLHHQPDPSPFV